MKFTSFRAWLLGMTTLRVWLKGRASVCQSEDCEFEYRHPLSPSKLNWPSARIVNGECATIRHAKNVSSMRRLWSLRKKGVQTGWIPNILQRLQKSV